MSFKKASFLVHAAFLIKVIKDFSSTQSLREQYLKKKIAVPSGTHSNLNYQN